MGDALQKRLDAKARMIPEAGFNLVGLDDYEQAGDELYLIDNFATRPEAEAAKTARLKENPDEKLFIYGSTDA
jgi:hypothetical protein